MNTIFATFAIILLVILIGSVSPSRALPPQIIYIQAAPDNRASGTGCLPLLVLVLFIVMVIAINPSF